MKNLRESLLYKKKLLGTQAFLGSKEVLEILGALEYDFVFICAEHPAYGINRLYDCIKACKYAGTPALVRLPHGDAAFTKKVLDSGVDGVLFPMIRSAEEAAEAMDLCVYPPFGKRGFGPMSAVRWGIDSESAFVKNSEYDLVRMIQIEHIDAVRDIKNIVRNRFIDAYIFGPNDLASSMGHINDMYNEEVQRVIKDTVKILQDNGKKFGVSLGNADREKVEYWNSMGMDIFSLGADFVFVRDGARRVYNELSTLL